MLREQGCPTKDAGGRVRRCFADRDFELLVQIEPDGCTYGFQLLYSDGADLWMLSWTPVEEYLHYCVIQDASGSGTSRHFTRIDPGDCDAEALLSRLRPVSAGLEPHVRSFVFELLHSHADDVRRCRYCTPRPRSEWHCPRCWVRACAECLEKKSLLKSRCTWTAASHEWVSELAAARR